MPAEKIQTAEERAAAEISKFVGGATKDGEAIPTNAGAEGNTTDAEKQALANEAAVATQTAKAAAGNDAVRDLATKPKPKTALDIAKAAIAHANGQEPEVVEETEAEAVTGDDEALEEDAEDTEGDAQQAPARPKETVQQRINKAVGKQRAAERDAAHWRAVAMQNQLAAIPAAPATAADPAMPTGAAGEKPLPKGLAPQPQAKDFEFGDADPKYAAALAGWETRKVILEAREEDATRAVEQAQIQERGHINARVQEIETAALEKYPDFHQVVVVGGQERKWALSPVLGEMILNSPHGADIAYTLATNPSEAQRVFGLTPLAQAAYFGKIEAFFENEAQSSQGAGEKPAPKPSKAPTPVRQARGQGGNAPPLSADTPDFAAFERMVGAGRKRKG